MRGVGGSGAAGRRARELEASLVVCGLRADERQQGRAAGE